MLRLALGLATGCHFAVPTPRAFVRHGPAHGEPVAVIAALPVRCGSTTMGCRPGYPIAVAATTRMALEFAGLTLVDSERINVELQRRATTTTRTADAERSETTIEGETWIQLDGERQGLLLRGMGIDAVLDATISMSNPRGLAGQRTVTIAIALSRLPDRRLAWQSQCSVETGDFNDEPLAIELATQCALESATLW
jgi:hypothetical protein